MYVVLHLYNRLVLNSCCTTFIRTEKKINFFQLFLNREGSIECIHQLLFCADDETVTAFEKRLD